MRAGAMRTYGTIERPVSSSDEFSDSGPVTWEPVLPMWADVRPLKGIERIESMKLEHNITHKMFIRYRSVIKPNMRFNTQGRYLYFEGFLPAQNKTHIEIMAREETE